MSAVTDGDLSSRKIEAISWSGRLYKKLGVPDPKSYIQTMPCLLPGMSVSGTLNHYWGNAETQMLPESWA